MNKEKRKEYQKAYREAHKEEIKAYNKEHKEHLKELRKKWYNENKEKHKELCKKYHEEHKDEIRAYQRNYHKDYNKAYYEAHKEELKAYRESHKDEIKLKRKQNNCIPCYDKFKEYLQIDDNKKKHYTRIKSSQYLFKTLKHTKIKEYEIHHCFGYDNFKHFIYIPKELHIEIHHFLRDNNINADSNHFSQIEHIIAKYLEQNDKHILVL